MSLFDKNKQSLKKLFSAHEKEGLIKFTDLLKLCSSTRIFPDLLSSPELHKALVEVAQDPSSSSVSQNLNFSQFEVFLAAVAAKAFPLKTESEQESMLFMHLKNTCALRYSLDFEVSNIEKRISNKIVPRLNIESTKIQRNTPKTTRRVSIKPSSTKNLKSSSFLFRNSPRKASVEKKHKGHAFSIITPRGLNDKLSTKPSPRPQLTERNPKRILKTINLFRKSQSKNREKGKLQKIFKILNKFKHKVNSRKDQKTIRCGRFAEALEILSWNHRMSLIQTTLAFKLWSLITKKLRAC